MVGRSGASAAARPPAMYSGNPTRRIARRPQLSDTVPKPICATCPRKNDAMISDVSVESGLRWNARRTSPNVGSMMSIPSAVRIIMLADRAMNSARVICPVYGRAGRA
jgi:hypothetical protein